MSEEPAGRPPPLLVTGLPRSGTTWLARQLTRQPGTSLLGREPMNPRTGQWALGGEVRGWTRWGDAPPARAAVRLRRAYAGREPRVLGRLGTRQWRSALPRTRVVVKDPFALLSLPAVVSTTGAVPVVVFRSADAILASYRRMGWRADLAELVELGAPVPPGADDDDGWAMAVFWRWMHARVLDDLAGLPGAVVVSHAELTAGGEAALRVLFARLGLDPGAAALSEPGRAPRGERVSAGRLHNLDRTPAEVLTEGAARVSAEERACVLEQTAEVAARLERVRLPLV